MSAEAWKSLFDVAALVLLFLTAAAGAGVLIFGNKVNEKQGARLRQFDSDLTKAKSDLAVQEERAAKAEAAIASAQAVAAEANKVAEGERLERVRLEAHLLPRRLSGVQIGELSDSLKRKAGAIVIVSAVLDGESSDFANDFETAFKNAGWKTLRYKNRITDDRSIQIGTVAGTNDGGETDAIAKFIGAVGITVVSTSFKEDDHSTSPWFEKNVLYLVINHKPELKTGAK